MQKVRLGQKCQSNNMLRQHLKPKMAAKKSMCKSIRILKNDKIQEAPAAVGAALERAEGETSPPVRAVCVFTIFSHNFS